MRTCRQPSNLTLCSLAVSLLLVSPGVFAYLDPTTGSMVISAIVGIFASIALALKTYWYKIKGFFKRNQQKDGSVQDSAVPQSRKQDSPE
jgi:O-antigen/teichoic acid export membrane protein